MNAIEQFVRRVDAAQQQSRIGGLVFGVIKKFGDDRGPSLAALLTYYGFMSLFPLLLVFTTVVGFIGNARIENTLIGTALKQLPVYGEQLGKNVAHPLTGSWPALVFGAVWLLYGSLGAAQASQHAMAQVWNIPGVARPGFVPRLGRGVLFFIALGVGVIASAGVSGIATAEGHLVSTRIIVLVGAVALNVALYVASFRILTPRTIPTRQLVPGAVVGALGYTALVTVGTALIQHQLTHAQAVYGQYGFVLGLISWLFLISQLTLYAAELNVVRSRHLWPRSIVQPPLTTADKRVLHDIAHQEERRPEQRVGVGFEPDPIVAAARDAAASRHHEHEARS